MKIGRVVGIIVTASLAGMLALGIAQAALATAHTSSAPRTAVSASDRTYCRALRTWDQAGIPSGSQTRTVARRALRANGKYRHTGTALVAAIVAGGSSSSEAHAALRACRGIR